MAQDIKEKKCIFDIFFDRFKLSGKKKILEIVWV